MVSQTRPHDAAEGLKPRGLRQMDPARDLGQIAHVIEVAFADELSPGGHVIMRDLRLLHALQPFIWVLSRAIPSFRDYMGGYVWVEEGRVVANVTLSRADVASAHWIISNVAVLPEYRRRGIARQLVEAAIEHARAMQGGRVLLQVRSDNFAARSLYEIMGFRFLESVTEMLAERVRPTRLDQAANLVVREPDPRRWYEAYDVARAAIPQAVQELRPLRAQSFRIFERSPLERLRDALFDPPRERWWVEKEDRLLALLTIDRQGHRQYEQVELLVAPAGVGVVEPALVNQVSARLRGHRGVRASVMAGLVHARALLQEAGFRELRTLDQMAKEL